MEAFIIIILKILGGAALGLVFWLGLLWTIQYGLRSKYYALLFPLSFFFRLAITVLGFYYLAETNWVNLMVVFLGFFSIRLVFLRRFKNPMKYKVNDGEEVSDEVKS
ncbi:N-ATPase subunit AtpR [Echinicola salinicaeni]|uniref:N-ATPase subunit AtpR n=1 Tax=Echinicola salinicaeni TaxID=2762757 RepID=UPI001646FF62|nr:ATP synthase subunit I [Echinicola salinicaeni]